MVELSIHHRLGFQKNIFGGQITLSKNIIKNCKISSFSVFQSPTATLNFVSERATWDTLILRLLTNYSQTGGLWNFINPPVPRMAETICGNRPPPHTQCLISCSPCIYLEKFWASCISCGSEQNFRRIFISMYSCQERSCEEIETFETNVGQTYFQALGRRFTE